jgi:uncharacterized protein (DUF488 family)
MDAMGRIWSVGHGARPLGDFLVTLSDALVELVADVRSFPGSRRHPQFGSAALAATLAEDRIAYVHLPGLGGRRTDRGGSAHVALRVAAFRAYADHLATAEFAHDYARLAQLASTKRVAFMCAETLWWRCHRRILADRLIVDGWEVMHLLAPAKSEAHVVWDAARVVEGRLVYDAGTLLARVTPDPA